MERLKCPKQNCGKTVEGYSYDHVRYLLRQHLAAKHPETLDDIVNEAKSNGD